MQYPRREERLITLLAALLACVPALAADPLGFYIGAGVGHSQVREGLDFSVFGVPGFSGAIDHTQSATGWKAIAGIRPLPIIGAEAEYLDFGTYGAGVQVKLSTLAVRAEYERIHVSSGDPDLLSLAVTWSLL